MRVAKVAGQRIRALEPEYLVRLERHSREIESRYISVAPLDNVFF